RAIHKTRNRLMEKRLVDTHDRGHVRRREPRGKIGNGLQSERAVLHVDHTVIEASGFDDPGHASRGKLPESGAKRRASLPYGTAYAILLHVSPPRETARRGRAATDPPH